MSNKEEKGPASGTEDDPIKITLLGGGGVGKSCVTIQFLSKTFDNDCYSTVENTYTTKITIDDEEYTIIIVDTAGQDEFKPLMDTWIRDSDCYLFCYDTTQYSSLNDVKEIILKAQRHKECDVCVPGLPFIPSVLIGCKCDMVDKKKVKTEVGKEFADQYLFTEYEADEKILQKDKYFLETSAKDNINIDDAFSNVVKLFIKRQRMLQNLTKKKKKRKGLGLFRSFEEEE
eukprot:gene4031-7320_t